MGLQDPGHRSEGPGRLKLHALSDIDSGEIVAYALTDGSVGDFPMLTILAETASERGHLFCVVYADGAHPSERNRKYLSARKMKFITSFKSNARSRNNGCLAKSEMARLWCGFPYDEWKTVSGHGTRWKSNARSATSKGYFRKR